MRSPNIISIAAFALLASSAAYAAPQTSQAPAHKHDMPMSKDGAQMQMMKDKAATAKTPAERNKLMAENMAK